MNKSDKIMVGVLVVIVALGVIAWGVNYLKYDSKGGSVAANSSASAPKQDFNVLAKQRFDGILSAAPEVQSITCQDNDCRYVVYFNLRSMPTPDDLSFLIRGNAATYSKFKQDNLGTSNVVVFATYNNQNIYSCEASNGAVKTCK